MATFARLERIDLPLEVAVAALAGGLVAAAFVLMPTAWLEGLVLNSGVAAFVAAAEPPLGLTARIALALIGGVCTAGLSWSIVTLLLGPHPLSVAQASVALRTFGQRSATPREPLFANRDLGTPFLEVRAPDAVATRAPATVERALPVDLDQPLAAFDPGAIPAVPRPVSPSLAPLAPLAPPPRPQLIDPGDRFETFELTPVARPVPLTLRLAPEPAAVDDHVPADLPAPSRPPSVVTPATEASVHALLDRLERGVAERAPAAKPSTTLQDTLGDLRRLATGAR